MVWAAHSHPLYGTVWADMMEVPPVYDQSSSLGGGELVLVNEYGGPVNDPASARRAIAAMGRRPIALLAGHGVLVTGGSARAVHQRAVALEQRCQRAWHIRAAGGSGRTALPDGFVEFMAQSDGEGFIGFWEAAVRARAAGRSSPARLRSQGPGTVDAARNGCCTPPGASRAPDPGGWVGRSRQWLRGQRRTRPRRTAGR